MLEVKTWPQRKHKKFRVRALSFCFGIAMQVCLQAKQAVCRKAISVYHQTYGTLKKRDKQRLDPENTPDTVVI